MALATGLKLSIKRIKAKIAAVVETGLATWHKMTANTWTGANRLPDSSTNSNSAALYTGRGLSFDGVNDVVTVGATGQTVRTVVFYAYPDTTTTAFMQLQSSGAVRVEISSGTLSATGFTSPTLYVNGVAGSTVAATTWQMIAVTSATGVSASNVLLGQSNTDYGSIDMSNVKFFSTELTAGQIAELYANPEQVLPTGVSAGELVGWWSLSQSQINISYDSTSNKDGSITGATEIVSINNITPQISMLGVSRYMLADGADDYLSLDSTVTLGTVYTLGAWLTATSTGHVFGSSSNSNYGMFINFTQLIHYPGSLVQWSGITPSMNTRSRIHLVITRNGNSVDLYVNGSKFGLTQTLSASFSYTFDRFLQNNSTTFLSGNLISAFCFLDNLTASEIAEIYNGGPAFDLNLNSGNYESSSDLAGWWTNAGGYLDLSGNGNNVSKIGNPIYRAFSFGQNVDTFGFSYIAENAGLLVLHADGYALITDAATLDITTAITLEAWVKPFTVSTAQTIIGKNTAYALGLTSAGKPVFTKWTSAASTATATTTTALTVNTWYHLAVTYDGTNVKIYIDGAIDTTTAVSGAIDSTSTDVLMGALTTSTELFSGYIDSVKIYSSDLTAAQVAENYNAETAAHSNA